MARHYSKDELCQMMKNVKNQKNMSKTRAICTYTSYANIMCSFFYHTYGWDAEQLNEYCIRQQDYYNRFINDPDQWFIQRKRIEDFMGDKMWNWCDDAVFTEPQHISKNKAINALNMKVVEINNSYMEECERYFLAHYNAMIDYQLSVEEMYNHYEKVDAWRLKYYTSSGNDVYRMHQELIDEVGIDVKLPTKKEFADVLCS